MAKRLCPYCKKEVYHKATVCPYCNQRIPAVAFSATSEGKWTMLIIGIFLLLCFVLGVHFQKEESKTQSIKATPVQEPLEVKNKPEVESKEESGLAKINRQDPQQAKIDCQEWFDFIIEEERVLAVRRDAPPYREWYVSPHIWLSWDLGKKERLIRSLSDCREILTGNIGIQIRDANSGAKLGKMGTFKPKIYY